MVGKFERDGIRFRYPLGWKVEREDNDSGWSVLVQSPETGFFMLTLCEEMPETGVMADTALAALREDYPDLEADECVDALAGRPACGHDIRFFSLDLTNSCSTRSFYSAHGTVLVMCQVNDMELESIQPILRAICTSLEVDDD